MASGKSSLPCGMLIVETRPSTQRSQVLRSGLGERYASDKGDHPWRCRGVGKSSLIRQFVYSEFSEEYFPTDSKTVHTQQWSSTNTFTPCESSTCLSFLIFHRIQPMNGQIFVTMVSEVPQHTSWSLTSMTLRLSREVRDVPALVKKHWKCSYVECSARHNYHVVSLFKELVKELACEKFGQKLPSYSSPRFESLHAHRERRGDSVVKCSIM
ncbi:hypothetical protein CEXT_270221 [Caerostris extrusa]|uniref:Uncharacterized protein n=1 Tax=Caerostris extrusa TaxID=172846 RepID=A0AAV4X9E3_CAEEX|nr:hypothetical protein CEXT_270221 [Caerostris extrusa]